ncbi:hypothetical protein M501DRAFT_141315 [Patellaria atrata CBS 101060]|uniref:Uncharacterized protein n=1 Tax=Patellaria atrata CBS 101060 TaxID=1346257 RepID=A0A9P4VRR9_9PEZI|nr:hypothetical protein M501DRAFT_141315 [Patellaria atrata CBS 101060]
MSTSAPYYHQLSFQGGSHAGHPNGYQANEEEYAVTQGVASLAAPYPDAPRTPNMLETFNHQAQQALEEHQRLESNGIAELLEAATVQNGSSESRDQAGRILQPSRTVDELRQSPHTSQLGKRKRSLDDANNSSLEQDLQVNLDPAIAADPTTPDAKRQKQNDVLVSTNDEAQVESTNNNSSPSNKNTSSSQRTEMRFPGMASAAALFREPTAAGAKKYTRPPMSKLYASLQLSPENFIHLQGEAKAYMLDPENPERQECVGSRGKGDTDMVKLKLFNCVRDFLTTGVGDKYFSESAPAPEIDETGKPYPDGERPPRKWVWPRDGTKIVTLVTPLLRRMVTNERQRQYAVVTRKGGGPSKKGKETTSFPQEENIRSGSVGSIDAAQQQHEVCFPMFASTKQISSVQTWIKPTY